MNYNFPPQQQHKSTLERFKSNPHKTRDPNTPGEYHSTEREKWSERKNLTIQHQVSSLTSSPDSSPSPGMMGVSQVSALLAQMLMHSNSLSFQSMMSNQQLIPGMSSQQMQGGQVGKIIPQKRFLTHCPLAGRRRGRSTAAAAAASDGPNEKRAVANHNQPCPGHC